MDREIQHNGYLRLHSINFDYEALDLTHFQPNSILSALVSIMQIRDVSRFRGASYF